MELSVRLPGVCLRRAEFRDIPALKQLFQETVLSVNRQDYTEEEVTDWASCGDNDERWEQIVLAHYTLVAKNEKGKSPWFHRVVGRRISEFYIRAQGFSRSRDRIGIVLARGKACPSGGSKCNYG